jgi:protein-tyrosine phosphatase
MAARAEIHFHLLPGVDDGPATRDESMELARLAVADGTLSIVATPHVVDIDVDELHGRVRELRAALAEERIPIELLAGGEVAAGDVFRLTHEQLELVSQGPASARWVLLESPHDDSAAEFAEAANELRERGFGVVVAHPERSAALGHGHGHVIRRELALGSWLQLNGMSLLGRHGETVRRAALRLLRDEQHTVLSSDAHNAARPPCLSEATRRARSDGVPAQRLEVAGRLGPRVLLEAGVAWRGPLVA